MSVDKYNVYFYLFKANFVFSEERSIAKNDFNVKVKAKLVTVVEGDPKAPFSIATTPKCKGGRNSIPWIAPPNPWSLP